MSFWERQYIVLGIASLISGIYYGVSVWQRSLNVGEVISPDISLLIKYIVLQIVLSVVGIVIVTVIKTVRKEDDIPAGEEDERDRLVRTRSEASTGHIVMGLVFLALLAWFAHGNFNLMFHTILGALIVGEWCRTGLQFFNYNRAF